ncbi:MAG TPA: hypothetical protein VFE17_05025 [Candidatus Baltobacteraceae bacterium]|jgi:hypothetical protein|nr:hypothetical protein [Candidatus Baltobacteraceae bacterium]
MNGTLLLAPDLLRTMRVAAHKAIELDEPVVTTRCILLALVDEDHAGHPEVLRVMLERAAQEEAPCEQTLAFKTPDGGATMRLSDPAYRLFIEGAQQADGRYTKAELIAALAARASQTI